MNKDELVNNSTVWQDENAGIVVMTGYDTEENRWFYAMNSKDLKVIAYFDDEEGAMNGAETLMKELESIDDDEYEVTNTDYSNNLVC